MSETIDEWMKEITIDDLPGDYQVMAKLIGVADTLSVSQHLGGQYFYFPKRDRMIAMIRNKKIKEEFTGFNHRELARKYNLSETTIRRIVEDKSGDDQPSLFSSENSTDES